MTKNDQPPIFFGNYRNDSNPGDAKQNWAIEGVEDVLSGLSDLILNQVDDFTMGDSARLGIESIMSACVKQLEWVREQNRSDAPNPPITSLVSGQP